MACFQCPKRSQSGNGSAACLCQDGFQRQNALEVQKGCLIRTPVDRGDEQGFRFFLLQIVMQAEVGNQSEAQVQKLLQLQVRVMMFGFMQLKYS